MTSEETARSERDSLAAVGAFVAVTLGISWAIPLVLVTDTVSPVTTLLMMFTPATVALAVRRVQGDGVRRTVESSLRGWTTRSLLFAVAYPLVFVAVAAVLALTTRLGTYQPGADNVVAVVLRQGGVPLFAFFLIQSLLRMYGEEFGWRGYLLPELTARWDRLRATAAVGVVWALFHSVFLYRAGVALGVANPLLVTAVQAGAVFTISFPFSYAYYLTDGSVVPVMLLHFVWNVVNPWILGDIYGNAPGLVAGRVFVVNGEGVVGLLLGLVAAAGFVVLFRRGPFVRDADRSAAD